MVGDHEVECNPSFRLYLHTAAESHEIPAAIATYVLMIYFHMTRSDIEEELLHRFMAKEKSRVDEEKMGLLQEYSDNAAQLTDLETKMKNCLSSNVRLMQDLPAIKKLAELKKQYEETIER
ncbi:hypothetical protein EB796_015244 [Bugula neritina]|uniref:Dynein heavy chain ATP-binding dynein motor region domain-containing protein n=1 Tax=Bugula neritina TaxID=10212 RepID=A0A7J7JKT7_BUGNE|nr:hypothetical protein EB796_015244 [Bugula neritina]